ncbi:hypothetical protein GJ496_011890 [Pomphorhynchus laevis]|nr:hypothetical protein GJ496_011890 [Pomphorhynchus laevis]
MTKDAPGYISSDYNVNDLNTSQLNVNNPLEKKRFAVLFLFLVCTTTNGFQWIQYSAVGGNMIFFYNESIPKGKADDLISLTTMIYMITYIILVLPATFALIKYGFRATFLAGSFINALGSFIKCFSISPNRFAIAMIGQTVASTAQIFTLGNPSYLAAVWFSDKHISTVAAMGVFGNQVGIALGFIIPSQLIGGLNTIDEIACRMKIIMYTLTVIEILVFIFAIPFFKERPKKPPSDAQASALLSKNMFGNVKHWYRSLKQLVINRNFIFLFIIYGIVTGVFYAISTNAYRYYEEYFPTNDKAAGIVGMIIVLSGLPGSIAAGFILDKTGAYKATVVGACTLTLVFTVIFSFVVERSLEGNYFLSFLLGFCMTGFLPIGFEVAAEITYPINEGLSSALLNVSAQIFGIALILLQLKIIDDFNVFKSNMFLCACLLVACIISFAAKMTKNRSSIVAKNNFLHAKNKGSSALSLNATTNNNTDNNFEQSNDRNNSSSDENEQHMPEEVRTNESNGYIVS